MAKILIATVLAASAALPGIARADALPAAAFAYESAAPLAVVVKSRSDSPRARTELVAFAGPDGARVTAEIVAPPVPGTRGPGVLFVHWLGDPKSTNHTEFEPDAYALAKRGVTSVLLDAWWSQAQYGSRDWFGQVRSTGTDYANSIAEVKKLRRALDLLMAQPGVDRDRIAFVGHDFGAMYGALLAGVDPRPRWYVLMAGNPSFADWFLLGPKPADVPAYRAQMAALDPPAYLARSHASGYLFQYALEDRYIAPADEAAFFAAAPPPRAMYVYRATHALAVPEAFADRLTWLQTRLFETAARPQ